jgi:arylsulfatase A-like enzyme
MSAAPPNILYLNSHDTGRYVQPYGHPVPTPSIQWLADQGVMFRNAFCAAPSCSGSRAGLLTGSYCHNNGMMGLAHRGFALHDPGQHIVGTLGEAGYHTELIGERHVSVTPDVLGYDVVHDIPDTMVASVAPAAIDALGADIPQPFFLSVSFFETHRSFFAPSSVRDRVYSLPPNFLPDVPEIRQDVAAYKASARSLDHGVGSVLNTLHETGLDRNTLVICTTDHGLAFPTAKASLLDRGIGGDAHHARTWHRSRQRPRRARLPDRPLPDDLRTGRDRASLRRLPLPGAAQLRRLAEQGGVPGPRMGDAAGGPRAAARPVLQPRRGPQLDR